MRRSLRRNLSRRHDDESPNAIVDRVMAADCDALLSTPDAAAFLGISRQWLELARHRGNYGPAYIRVTPRLIRYRKRDLIAYLDAQRHVAQESDRWTYPWPIGWNDLALRSGAALLISPQGDGRVPLSYPTIWRLMQKGRSRNMRGKIAWIESEVDAWITNRPVVKLKGDENNQRKRSWISKLVAKVTAWFHAMGYFCFSVSPLFG
jgi:predicted DNA-binding transcriptional regulator AlpA